jgi:uncharacterized membrane protein YphA (DoxX/SURF4 family)
MDAVFLAGRILFALIFVVSGLTVHLAGRAQGVQYARAYNAPARNCSSRFPALRSWPEGCQSRSVCWRTSGR